MIPEDDDDDADLRTPPEPPRKISPALLAQAEQHLDQAMAIFQGLLHGALDGEPVPLEAAENAARALLAATQTLFDIRMILHDEATAEPGEAPAGDIDLALARDRVGRLLDRLRAAQGTD